MEKKKCSRELQPLSLEELNVEELEERLEMTLVPLAPTSATAGGNCCDCHCSQFCGCNG